MWNKLYVDKNVVDAQVDDMTAPAAVKSAPSPNPPQLQVEAIPVAKGVWYERRRRKLDIVRV